MIIGVFNQTAKTGNSSFALNLVYGLAQRGEKVLLVSDGNGDDPIDGGFIALSIWRGGYRHFEDDSSKWKSCVQDFRFIVVDIPSGQSEKHVRAISRCDEVLLMLPKTGMALEGLPRSLEMISQAKKQNSDLVFRGIVEAKKPSSSAPSSQDNQVHGTWDTIKGLYPGLFVFPAIPDSNEYADLHRRQAGAIRENPESEVSAIFRKIAASLDPGDVQDHRANRYQRRQIEGKPLTEETVFEKILTSIKSIFS